MDVEWLTCKFVVFFLYLPPAPLNLLHGAYTQRIKSTRTRTYQNGNDATYRPKKTKMHCARHHIYIYSRKLNTKPSAHIHTNKHTHSLVNIMAVSATNPHTQKTFHSHLLAVSARTVGIHCPVVRTYIQYARRATVAAIRRLPSVPYFPLKKQFFFFL